MNSSNIMVLFNIKICIIFIISHLGIFASSCENMPNILIETMAAGLPIACSNRGPMFEVLGDAGLYFNPENSNEIFDALEQLITQPELRNEKANESFDNVQRYKWSFCTNETFLFLDEVISVLDDAGKERIVEVLLREDMNTYLVSHGWSHPLLEKIEVVKDGNTSVLE